MKAVLAAAVVALAVLEPRLGAEAAVEPQPDVGTVLDVGTFSEGTVRNGYDDRFEAVTDGVEHCAFDREVTPEGHQKQRILRDNTCLTGVKGAPRPGYVTVFRNFTSAPGQAYKASVMARVAEPVGSFRARVVVAARAEGRLLAECTGRASALAAESPSFRSLETETCVMPAETTTVRVGFRAEALEAGASGAALLSRFRFVRCAEATPSCPTSAPSRPPTSGPPPIASPTTVAPSESTVSPTTVAADSPTQVLDSTLPPLPVREEATRPTEGGRDGRPLRLIGALVLAAAVLLVVPASVLARRRDRRERVAAALPEPPPVPPSTLLLEPARAPGTGRVGQLATSVLDAWVAAADEAPRVVAAWEGEGQVTFLLDADEERTVPPATETVAFTRLGESIQAVARPGKGLTRVGRVAADGLLVPVGSSRRGLLHLPLLGAPMGFDDARTLAAVLRSADARLLGDGARVLAVGAIPALDVARVERVGPDREPAVRRELEAELNRREAILRESGAGDVRTHAAKAAGEPIPPLVLVLDERAAAEWADLVERGARLGLAVLVLGRGPATRRVITENGWLRVEGIRIDGV